MDDIEKAVNAIRNTFMLGGKLILFGNGGSAADSQHIAAEFVGHNPPLAALALTTDTSALTAIANDYGFSHVFERQIRALCKKEDCVIGISTSGESKNVLKGILAAKKIGAFTIGLTSANANSLSRIVDLSIEVVGITAQIQEQHIRIGHRIANSDYGQ